jgi:hypothetical protein
LGKGLLGLGGLTSGITGKPAGGTPFGTSDTLAGIGSFKGKELPQGNVRSAAGGGLMRLAEGGAAAQYSPSVEDYTATKNELQRLLPGRNLSDADYNWWANNGGAEAVRREFTPVEANGPTQGEYERALQSEKDTMEAWKRQRENVANVETTSNGDLAKQLWSQYGNTSDPTELQMAMKKTGVTAGDIASAAGVPAKAMAGYLSQYLNPAVTKFGSLQDYVNWKDQQVVSTSPGSWYVVDGASKPPAPVPSPAPAPFNPAPPPAPVSPPVAPQPYPYDPGDIYNPLPEYGDIGDPGITPIVTTQTPMPAGEQPYTTPYEAIRYSSRLLQEGARPGQAWNRGGGQVIYKPVTAARGGLMGLQQGNLGRYAGGGLGRLVQGPGDGVSDSIPATIDGQRPALIAQGEYVMPARVVSELGNGSTDAGAARLDAMVAKIEQAGRAAKRGGDSGAHRFLG